VAFRSASRNPNSLLGRWQKRGDSFASPCTEDLVGGSGEMRLGLTAQRARIIRCLRLIVQDEMQFSVSHGVSDLLTVSDGQVGHSTAENVRWSCRDLRVRSVLLRLLWTVSVADKRYKSISKKHPTHRQNRLPNLNPNPKLPNPTPSSNAWLNHSGQECIANSGQTTVRGMKATVRLLMFEFDVIISIISIGRPWRHFMQKSATTWRANTTNWKLGIVLYKVWKIQYCLNSEFLLYRFFGYWRLGCVLPWNVLFFKTQTHQNEFRKL